MNGAWDRFVRDTKRMERPGSPDEVRVRPFTNGLGEQKFIVEGRRLGIHLGDKVYRTRDDALAFARMLAGWESAKLIDETGR